MDAKASPQLDPKLQEAYDRVMGVQVPPPTGTTSQSPATTMTSPAASQSEPVVTVTSPVVPEPTVIPIDNTSVTKSHTFVAKKGMKVSPVILALGAVAFLLVYTVVWIKVFNLSVPFINQ